MSNQSIERSFNFTPKRERPAHIAIPPLTAILQPLAKAASDDSAVPPRPPIPPRRHTLAEICRYADEQCAYIEWMTRELEAEEANRHRSMPTTPAGAITNPFSGPADMWWRPMSANDMYGKSALRQRQEEEGEAIKQHPYLATKGPPNLLETKESLGSASNTDDGFDEVERTSLYTPSTPSLEVSIPGSERSYQAPDNESPETARTLGDHEGSPVRLRALATNESPQGRYGLDLPCLEQGSTILLIPRALLCFLLLPLVFAIGWFDLGIDDAEEEESAQDIQHEEEEFRGRTRVRKSM